MAAKLSDAMIGALVSVYNSGTPGKKNTMDALENRGLITYKSGQVVITAEGRKAIDADNDLIGVQSCGTVLYGSLEAHNRVIEAVKDSEGLTEEEWQEAIADTVTDVQEVMFGGGENGDKVLQAEVYDHMYANWEKELCGFGATIGWKNTKVWDGLTAQEIREDMDTAVPINRAARRQGQKISRRFIKALNKVAL